MPRVKESLAPDDLLLHLNAAAKEYDLSKYEDFLYEFCGEWEFQREAIRNILRFYLSGQYKDSKQLLEENYENNQEMQAFAEKGTFVKNLPFPYKLACTIDIATGCGKSWVMYAVARILLAEGVVDRVLVLCPSRTIKYELNKKFTMFNENSIYTDALPKDAVVRVPGLKHADETIEKGDICIDNVHKTYDHVSSSISDSLERQGTRTLVINDEAHHILNPKGSGENATMLEWKRFLDDEKFGFRYILNVSGTPYKDNSYFNDVIYRYSIRDAITNKFVKDINYLEKDETDSWKQKWKTILSHHQELKKEYPKAKKHITIVVTNSISETDKLAEEIKGFLRDNIKLSDDQVDKMVLPVTSSPRHEENRAILKTVDQKENPVEWIVSVSMLTEGWDVANIFQIVPHESRAFNSKLLIAQVLGRGLRVPPEYQNNPPKVWVYNHAAWSSKIDRLVMEVAEISNYIRSRVNTKSKYNFDLHCLNTDKRIETKTKIDAKTKIRLPETFGFSTTQKVREQTFVSVRERRRTYQQTNVADQIRMFTVEEAVNDIFSGLYLFDMARGTTITERVSKDYIRKILKKELQKISETEISEENLQSAKASFNVLVRQFTGQSRIEEQYGDVEILNTSKMQDSLLSESAFKHYGGLVTTKENLKKMDEEEQEILEKIKKDVVGKDKQTTLSDESYIRSVIIDTLTEDQYRSPLDVTLLSHSPEREFIQRFVKDYVKYVDAWVKSKDRGFYAVPYIHRPGTHSLQKDFNPDFFFKKGKKIIVVEIKSEDDSSVKNKDKYEGASIYFEKLNEKLKGEYTYAFLFLDERDYTSFFQTVLVHDKQFVSKLQSDLASKKREQLKEGR